MTLHGESNTDACRDGVCKSVCYDDPDGIYRIVGGDRTCTFDELVVALEGDTTGLGFERSVDSYFAVRDRIIEGRATGIITRVDLDHQVSRGRR